VTDNKILKEDKRWGNQLGVILHPQVTINNITYRGDFNGYDIFQAVCAGFLEQPDICKGDNIFAVIEEQEDQLAPSKRHRWTKLFHIVGGIVLVIGFNLCALAIYKRYQRKKMNEELAAHVNSAVTQYFRLSG
jgi:hypothetical protein